MPELTREELLKRHPRFIVDMIEECPDKEKHEHGPVSLLGWDRWAEEKERTHTQVKCKCGFYLIWKPKLREIK